MCEILILHKPELAERDPISGDRLELRPHDDGTFTLAINGYDGLLIGLTRHDMWRIINGLHKAMEK